MPKQFIGIDVGKNGGFARIGRDKRDIQEIEVFITPLIGKGKGAQVDKQKIKDWFNGLKRSGDEIIVVVEDVHSIFGTSAGSNFQFGKVAGILEGLLEGMEIPYVLVQPKVWQAVSFQGVPVINKVGSKAKGSKAHDTKAMALIAAQRLYPKLDMRRSLKAEKAHDGIVDALLMAHYAKIKL